MSLETRVAKLEATPLGAPDSWKDWALGLLHDMWRIFCRRPLAEWDGVGPRPPLLDDVPEPTMADVVWNSRVEFWAWITEGLDHAYETA